jgi:hypothetical protein
LTPEQIDEFLEELAVREKNPISRQFLCESEISLFHPPALWCSVPLAMSSTKPTATMKSPAKMTSANITASFTASLLATPRRGAV